MPKDLIKPYYSVFGHFYLDHLFQIYKIKKWYEEKDSIFIDSLHVNIDDTLIFKKYPFIIDFYSIFFKNISFSSNSNNSYIDLGIIMGSSESINNGVIVNI